MDRSLAFAVALASAAMIFQWSEPAAASERMLPMRFDLRLQVPAQVTAPAPAQAHDEACAINCKTLISASGAITADSARDFMLFAHGRDLTGAIVVLDSDGGSVHGAIALGREIRRRGLATMVGRAVDLGSPAQHEPQRAVLSPRADCESMCAFVLLGGVHRSVPQEARVLVHQIWLGDRRDDPAAANYSAEDLVLVQRDIGKLARYVADMGATIDLLDLALRIPPWEPMHAMTRDELRRTRLATEEIAMPAVATVAASPPAPSQPAPRGTDGAHARAVGERGWALIDRAGVASLARRHPLTVEGEDIGSFDLMVSCGDGSGNFNVSYAERRHGGERAALPDKLSAVTLRLGARQAVLKLASTERGGAPAELVTYATGAVPAALIDRFAAAGNHSMLIETRSDSRITTIRLGNTGAQRNLPRLAARCGAASDNRAALAPRQTNELAAAQ